MNKVLAEIIAGVIPHKMTRNQWRGILRYGIFKAIRLRHQLRHDRTQPRYCLAVCAIVGGNLLRKGWQHYNSYKQRQKH